ncbi:hypothetical protein EYF80_015322 [Liparis tanakae]|uniref:Uncharacterized protein n=1 Tax=Liparis tanakae TaxID=230148 RepID=A0A4Z2IAX3_9TELE|nr:hypothetical protein EYF80_015322 [Liparis tanakae]
MCGCMGMWGNSAVEGTQLAAGPAGCLTDSFARRRAYGSSWSLTFSQLCRNNSNSASLKPQRLETDPRGLPPNQLGLLLLGTLTLVAAASR